MRCFRRIIYLICVIATATPVAVFGQTEPLRAIYEKRADLRAVFEPVNFHAIDSAKSGLMLDLEDWARNYGWKEHKELSAYKPKHSGALPARVNDAEIESRIGAVAYVVVDRETGKILTVKQENRVWPIASLSKLVTASIVLDENIPLNAIRAVRASDDVGGAKLSVSDGDRFTINDLFYASLVASANNAANALALSTGFSKEEFVEKMNEKARSFNLRRTRFEDPTGIETGNVSTALEMARLSERILENTNVRKYTSTAYHNIRVLNKGILKKMTNTNWMLFHSRYDDVYVTSGKTGYLDEAGWNFVVTLRPDLSDTDRELLIVLFGAKSRASSFEDAQNLADWAWKVYKWSPNSQAT